MSKKEVCMCYFNFAVGFWRPEDLRSHFRDMKDMGADSVVINYYETAYEYLKPRIELAHAEGLKVYPIPARTAGLFAAGIRPSSMFAAQHWNALMQRQENEPISGETVACVNNPEFIKWFYPFMKKSLMKMGGDGIFFDEPKDAHDACYCNYCKDKISEPTTANLVSLREESMAEMLGKVSSIAKEINTSHKTIAMLMAGATEHFREEVLKQSDLEYIGFDGPLCDQGEQGRKDDFLKANTYLCDTLPAFIPKIKAANKKVILLVETFDVQPWAVPALAKNIEQIVDWDVDFYTFNYYPHANSDPEAVMNVTRDIVKRIKS